MNQNIKTNIWDFAYLPNWNDTLDHLASMAIAERWDSNESPKSILKNYVRETFTRLASLRNQSEPSLQNSFIFIDDHYACFNTGLFTDHYSDIYALFYKNNRPDAQPWVFDNFYTESTLKYIHPLPNRAQYFNDIHDLIYDTSLPLRKNLTHILGDERNKQRIPNTVRDKEFLTPLFYGAIEIALKKVEANYKVAVPQSYNGEIQFLLPICLQNNTNADLALAVSKQGDFYIAHTCLTLEMAYSNARLITKPEIDWLN